MLKITKAKKKCSKFYENSGCKFWITLSYKKSILNSHFKSQKSAKFPNEILDYSSLCTAPTPMALFIFSHIKKKNPTIHDENKNSPHIFTWLRKYYSSSLLTAEDFWFFCDLYQQVIAPINLWNKCIDLRLFSKYLSMPFLRPLRSEDDRCWIFRLPTLKK